MKKVALRPKAEETEKPLPAALRGWRTRLRWTQARAAEHMGCSLRTYENWEQGYKAPRHPIAVRKLMKLTRTREEA